MPDVLGYMMYGMFVIFMWAILAMPYLGKSYAVTVACFIGPIAVLVFWMRLAQYRIFGPLTGQDFMRGTAFNFELWQSDKTWMFILPLFLLPFYNEIRSVLHLYYMRCLSHNFFAEGKDRPFSDLATKSGAYCPFLLVTGTSSDYQSPFPSDTDKISEMSFSSLHVGSIETKYVKQMKLRSMGKCTALTAAGCIDAVALTISTLLTMRFWLEALNLSWGDYIMFSPPSRENSSIAGWEARIDKYLAFFRVDIRAWVVNFFHRLPASFCVWVVWLLLFEEYFNSAVIAFLIVFCLAFINLEGEWVEEFSEMTQSPWLRQLCQATGYHYRGDFPPRLMYVTDGGCRDCVTLTQLVLRRQKKILMVLAASDPHDELGVLRTAIDICKGLGFVNFYDPIDPRRDLNDMFTDFKMNGNRRHMHIGIYYAPGSDGEVIQVTSAGSPAVNGEYDEDEDDGCYYQKQGNHRLYHDPESECWYIEEGVDTVEDWDNFKIYYSPGTKDGGVPLKDWRICERGERSKPGGRPAPTLELIKAPATTGHLFIVKNRGGGAPDCVLPEAFIRDVQPHLTQESMLEEGLELRECAARWQKNDGQPMKNKDLGALCCCDCSHTNGWHYCGNCGPTFPHGTFSNFMYMTPMWCNCLARLAFDMSKDAIKMMTDKNYEENWERQVDKSKAAGLGSRRRGGYYQWHRVVAQVADGIN